jgi:hypothetical protein
MAFVAASLTRSSILIVCLIPVVFFFFKRKKILKEKKVLSKQIEILPLSKGNPRVKKHSIKTLPPVKFYLIVFNSLSEKLFPFRRVWVGREYGA